MRCEVVSKTDGWVLIGILESFLVFRALGYADEPWVVRWAPCFAFTGMLVVSGDPSDLWSNLVILLGVASLVAHVVWAHNVDAHWSISDAARRGALIKTATDKYDSKGKPPRH